MDPLLLAVSWVICFVLGIEVGGHWASWIARKVVRYAGVEWEFEQALQALRDPRNWRD